MKASKIFWGLVILIIGLVFLGINFNLIPNDIWNNFAIFWPVIIVLIGLSLVLKNSYTYLILAILILGAVTYLAIKDPFDWQSEKSTSSNNTNSEQISENYDKNITSDINLTLDLGAADINVSNLDDHNLNTLVTGDYRDFHNIKKDRSDLGHTAKLTISEQNTGEWFNKGFTNRNFNLKISDKLPLVLTLNTGASDLDVSAKDLKLKELNYNAGASDLNLELGNKEDIQVINIKSGASDIKVRVPSSSGIRFVSDSALSSKNFNDLDLEKSGNKYTSKDFEQASKKIYFNISTGISSIEIEQY